jgi:hypothetical protein
VKERQGGKMEENKDRDIRKKRERERDRICC